MEICEDFWDEFIKWAVPFVRVKPDADVYDVLMWIRNQQKGTNPFSDSFIEKIDKEIERELGPWT